MQPIVFVVSDKVIINLAMIWAAIPIAFIVFKIAGVQLISGELADRLIYGMGFAWPALKAQYEAIQQLRLWLDAANYSLFAFLLSVLTAFSIVYIVVRFFRCRSQINKPAKVDFFFVLVGAPCSIYALFFDRLDEKPLGLYHFYIDGMGSYYIRQWIGVSCIWFTLVVGIVIVLEFLSSLKRVGRS